MLKLNSLLGSLCSHYSKYCYSPLDNNGLQFYKFYLAFKAIVKTGFTVKMYITIWCISRIELATAKWSKNTTFSISKNVSKTPLWEGSNDCAISLSFLRNLYTNKNCKSEKVVLPFFAAQRRKYFFAILVWHRLM